MERFQRLVSAVNFFDNIAKFINSAIPCGSAVEVKGLEVLFFSLMNRTMACSSSGTLLNTLLNTLRLRCFFMSFKKKPSTAFTGHFEDKVSLYLSPYRGGKSPVI